MAGSSGVGAKSRQGSAGSAGRQGVADQPGLDARLLVPALLAWIAVAAMLSLRPMILTLFAAGFAVVGAMLMRPRWSRRSWVSATAITLLGTSLCLLATAAQSSVREAGLVPGLAVQRASATVEAVVVSDPRVIQTKGIRPVELVIVRVSVRTVVGRGQRSESSTPVMVFGDKSWANVR